MKMTKSFQEKMLDMGVLHLKNASKKMKDNENFVNRAIEKYGISELQYASDRIRSEGHILLGLSFKYPSAVKYALQPVYQRYIGEMGEDVAEVFEAFPIYLMDANQESFKYMPIEMATYFYNFACSNTGCYLSFYGGDKRVLPQYGKKYIDNLDALRPDVRKAAYDERMKGYAKAKTEAMKQRAQKANEEKEIKKPVTAIVEERATNTQTDGAENE